MSGKSALSVIVAGTGMYTTGRNTDGYGTIMPAIFEWARDRQIGKVFLAGTRPEGIRIAKKKIGELQRSMGAEIPVEYFPKGDRARPGCYKEAIDKTPHPACAIIAVPDNLHHIVAKDAIRRGLHTLVVKPLVSTLAEARDLIEAQDGKGVYCAVEFHKRLDLANLKLQDVISRKRIGDPLYFLVEFSQRKSIPHRAFRRWVTATNVFQYLGVHYVDVIYFATGAAPRRVMATGQKDWLASKGIDAYDSIQAVIEWALPSGKRFISHILTNWVDPESTSAMSDQKIKVIGTKGRFESDQKDRGITIVDDPGGIEHPNPYFCGAYGTPGNIQYRGYGIESIHQFLDDVVRIESGKVSVEGLEDKRPTFKQSLVPTAVLEGVNKSLSSGGKWIKLKGV